MRAATMPCFRRWLATLGVLVGLAGLPALARGEFLARGFTPPALTGQAVAPDHDRLTAYRPHPGVRPAPRRAERKVARVAPDEEQRRLLLMQLVASTMMVPGDLSGWWWPPPNWVPPPYVIQTPSTPDTPAGPTGGPTPGGGGTGGPTPSGGSGGGPGPGGTPVPAGTPEPTGLLLGLLGSGLAGLGGWSRRRRAARTTA